MTDYPINYKLLSEFLSERWTPDGESPVFVNPIDGDSDSIAAYRLNKRRYLREMIIEYNRAKYPERTIDDVKAHTDNLFAYGATFHYYADYLLRQWEVRYNELTYISQDVSARTAQRINLLSVNWLLPVERRMIENELKLLLDNENENV